MDIDRCVELFFECGRAVCSVVKVEDAHPARMYQLDASADCPRITSLQPDLADTRRQDLPPVYHRNGSVYVFGREVLKSRRIIERTMTPYIMPEERSYNIDTELDFFIVRSLIESGALSE